MLESSVLSLPRTPSCFEAMDRDPRLDYSLPKKGALAGDVLKHVYKTLDCHLERWKPSIYKIGFTHDPCWRFYNKIYGYCRAVEKWEGMKVVFMSDSCTAPAFVEAATIQRHLGALLGFFCAGYR